MNANTSDPLRLIQTGSDQLGHSTGAIDGLWGLRTALAMKALLAANGRAAAVAPQGPIPWITKAKSALGRHEARHRTWLMDWLKRDGRSLGDPSKNPWCGDFVETCVRVALPDEPFSGGRWAPIPSGHATGCCSGRRKSRHPARCLCSRAARVGTSVSRWGGTIRIFYVLGGNQSDAVTIARIAKSRLLGARWPVTIMPRQQRLRTIKPGEFLGSTNQV